MKIPLYINGKHKLWKSHNNLILNGQIIPINTISFILKHNNIQIPHQVLEFIAKNGIIIKYSTYSGKAIGSFHPYRSNGIEKEQYTASINMKEKLKEKIYKFVIKKTNEQEPPFNERTKAIKQYLVELVLAEVEYHIYECGLTNNIGVEKERLSDDILPQFNGFINSLINTSINKSRLKVYHFNEKGGLCMLSNEGKRFIQILFEEEIMKPRYDEELGERINYRKRIRYLITSLVMVITSTGNSRITV